MPGSSSKPVKLSAGDFRIPFSVQSKQPVSDDRGGVKLTWVDVFPGVFGKDYTKVGTLLSASGETISTVQHFVYIRWRPGIVGGMRLKHTDGRALYISSVSEYQMRREYLELMCTELDPSGGDTDGG